MLIAYESIGIADFLTSDHMRAAFRDPAPEKPQSSAT